ncbi:expressed protein [Phakopsora pachyrhizi]|uniref:Expressed protein n=1 Tax=Phakopsora pachyrhizi TaxID=170000 RepID=A0AAV0B7U9_PHAPC|nr:expressed protein [Phakopsora pachyrhizi]
MNFQQVSSSTSDEAKLLRYSEQIRLIQSFRTKLKIDRLSYSITDYQGDRSVLPFRLVSKFDPRLLGTDDDLDLILVWVIDCFDQRLISGVFRFLKTLDEDGTCLKSDGDGNNLYKRSKVLGHLKSIKPIPTYLTSRMMNYGWIRGLIEVSTPYRNFNWS